MEKEYGAGNDNGLTMRGDAKICCYAQWFNIIYLVDVFWEDQGCAGKM